MVNPNSGYSGESSETHGTEWESLESMAGKMDRFDAQVAREAIAARQSLEEKKAKLNEFRNELSDLAKPSNEFYVDGLDVREFRHDTSSLEKQAGILNQEITDTRRQFDNLSTEEGRQAEAERRRKEAEDYDKYYTAGIRAVGVEKMEEFDRRIDEMRNPDARKKLEEEREAYIKDVVLPLGRTILGDKNSNEENVANEEKTVILEDQVENMTPELKDVLEKAERYSEKVDQNAIKDFLLKEHQIIIKAINKVKHIDEKREDSTKKSGFIDKYIDDRDYGEAMNFLKRSGYTEGGRNSRIFETLKNDSSYEREYNSGALGKERAKNYRIISLVAEGGHGKGFKKELKRAGLKMPESWDDENFTTNEMYRIAQMARNAF